MPPGGCSEASSCLALHLRPDVSTAVKAGKNTLEVAVVNTWNNRLIGDAALPPKQRQTSLTKDTKKPNSPLQPSGLLVPVTVLTTGGLN